MDPAILVAVVSGASATISVLVTGLLQIVQLRSQKIVLQATNGRRLEIPANSSSERIQELIKILEQMEIKRIKITSLIPTVIFIMRPKYLGNMCPF